MRLSLFYNKDAGEGVSADELKQQLERGGHEVVRAVRRGTRTSDLFDPPVQLVVAAGGDGTIAAAAKAVAGTDIPLAILPLGTANNIAQSLGIDAPLPELIESWKHAVQVPFDLGMASSANDRFPFVESVGGGLIPAGISAAVRAGEDEDAAPELRVAEALLHFRDALRHLHARRFELAVDGNDISDEFLAVEILNIRSVGPNVVLSPHVSSSDGLLSVVTAREEHRNALRAYLDDRIAGRSADLSLPTRLAAAVEISGAGPFHVDDRSEKAPRAGVLSLRVRPSALRVLKSSAP